MEKTLNEIMELGHVIHVSPDGNVTDAIDEYAPEVSVIIDDRLEIYSVEIESTEWTLLEGFTGQDRYNGPAMHSSETISGGLERHILEHPGFYVATYDASGEDDSSWFVAFKPCFPCEDATQD